MSDQPTDKPTDTPGQFTPKPKEKKPRVNYSHGDGRPADTKKMGENTKLLIDKRKENADARKALLEQLCSQALAGHFFGIEVKKKIKYAVMISRFIQASSTIFAKSSGSLKTSLSRRARKNLVLD